MTRDPPPLHFVGLSQNVELFPEITIENRIAVALYPAAFLPARQIFRHTELDVLRVCDYRYAARFLERSKAADCSFEFHAVVRGFVLETSELPLVPSKRSFEAQPPGPGLPLHAPSITMVTFFLFVCVLVLLSTELAQDERRNSRAGRAT